MSQTTQTPARTASRHYPLGWLRAVAALAVVTFHAYQFNRTRTWPFSGTAHRLLLGTDLFVDMFFVLSAFVLWAPVAQAAITGTTGRPGWLVLFRRTARLAPLYVTVVLVVWAVTNPSLPGHWRDLLMHLTFTQVYSDQYIFWTDGPAWSLAVEFHYYLLIAAAIPVTYALARRTSSRVGRVRATLLLPALCVVAGLAYLAWNILVLQTAETSWSAWFNPLAKAADFGIGMGLAVMVASGVRISGVTRVACRVVSVAGLLALVLARPFHGPETNWWHPLFALAVAVGLASIVLTESEQPAWMSWRPLAWLGGLGYGIYLIHEPVLRLTTWLGLVPEPRPGPQFLVTTVVVAVPTIALAWLSARTVEEAGRKTLGLVDETGHRRDYYAHVAPH